MAPLEGKAKETFPEPPYARDYVARFTPRGGFDHLQKKLPIFNLLRLASM